LLTVARGGFKTAVCSDGKGRSWSGRLVGWHHL
jgi:hypothetical protein